MADLSVLLQPDLLLDDHIERLAVTNQMLINPHMPNGGYTFVSQPSPTRKLGLRPRANAYTNGF